MCLLRVKSLRETIKTQILGRWRGKLQLIINKPQLMHAILETAYKRRYNSLSSTLVKATMEVGDRSITPALNNTRNLSISSNSDGA